MNPDVWALLRVAIRGEADGTTIPVPVEDIRALIAERDYVLAHPLLATVDMNASVVIDTADYPVTPPADDEREALAPTTVQEAVYALLREYDYHPLPFSTIADLLGSSVGSRNQIYSALHLGERDGHTAFIAGQGWQLVRLTTDDEREAQVEAAAAAILGAWMSASAAHLAATPRESAERYARAALEAAREAQS